ncbi:MAG: hypothetical protein ONB44_10180 [candidate division KSB1 bacterium]|nr:hypothetical protein [candidate division KSB1 bacterium]MDZ7302491.1 hypothetical protein [candidate division KSB1 bacterium]MDZ7311913.1 hypothetical protein [candidate division KSB1 bacterium]
MWSNRSFSTTHDAPASACTSSIPASPFEPDETSQEEDAFKKEVIKDILCQIDYRAAWRQGIVDLPFDELAEEMRLLSTRALVAWYEAFLYIRSELMFSGYELNGFKILDRPYDAIRKLIENDPNFDIRQYIF